jgi:hypothetical protein
LASLGDDRLRAGLDPGRVDKHRLHARAGAERVGEQGHTFDDEGTLGSPLVGPRQQPP